MSDSKKKNEIDRRSFLMNLFKGAGVVSAFPAEIFLSNMIIQFMQKGYAQAAGLGDGMVDNRLVNISLSGGIPRWYWDGILTPNGNDLLDANPMVISRFRNQGGSIAGEYATTKIGNYHLPWTWAANIPTASGGTVPMSALAQNMLNIRGVNTLIDSHDLNRQRHIATTPGGISLTGLLADKATTPIPAVQRGHNDSFYGSELGIAYTAMNGSNPFSAALTPFLPTNNITGIKSDQIENAIDLAMAKMNKLAADKHRYLPSSFQARANAKALMKRQFGNLQGSFITIGTKYLELMKKSCGAAGNLSLQGVDDIAFGGSVSAPFRIVDGQFFTGSDIRQNVNSSSYISGLAEALAVAEFMIKENLSSAFSLDVGSITGTRVTETRSSANGSVIGDRAFDYSNDAHFLGSHMALLVFSRYFRAFSAGLYEFIQQLKAMPSAKGNVFNQTAITVTSEFNRTPQNGGGGSDHGWEGASYSIFSGMVDQLTVIGNIKSSSSSSHGGTWGFAGGVSELGGREALLGNCLSTVSTFVDIKTPMPNDQSFVMKQNNKVVTTVKSCKNLNKAGQG